MSKAYPWILGPQTDPEGPIFGPDLFSSVEKATIILGFIEFYLPETDVTTEIETEKAIGISDYHSRRETELFPRMIFYNRVGKCGSRSVLRCEGFNFYCIKFYCSGLVRL